MIQHNGVRYRSEQCDTRRRRQTGDDFAYDRTITFRRRTGVVRLRRLRFLQYQSAGNALMQQQLNRFHQRIGVEARLPDIIQQHVRQRNQRHADVMRHVRANERQARARGGARVVKRVAETVLAECPQSLQRAQIVQRQWRVDLRRERRRIRRNDKITAQSALECEVGNAECAVLVGLMAVANVVRALAHAPRDIPSARI